MILCKLKGDVLDVVDEVRDLPVRDKDGNPTEKTKSHRMTTINLLVKNETGMTMVTCKGFDLPATFACPKVGEKWETPRVTALTDRPGQSPTASFQA